MSVYLRDIPLQEAIRIFDLSLKQAGYSGILGEDVINLDEFAVGRVLAKPAWAKLSSPHYHSSAMDGFAVRSADTNGAQPMKPVRLRMGEDSQYLDTGDPIPPKFDAVIPIENIEALDLTGQPSEFLRDPAWIQIRASVPPWSNIRPLGEDIVATQLVFPSGHVIRPADLGALAAAGFTDLLVARKPRVAILPTGDELVPLGISLQPGDILEFNSLVMAAQVNIWGGVADRFPVTKDNLDDLRARILAAAEDHDLILLNAGSSAGADDYSARVIEELGTLLVHGVAVRPGHPVILGMIRRGQDGSAASEDRGKSDLVPIIGVPGYPVSAALTGEIFIEPLLALWTGRKAEIKPVIKAQLTRKITSPAGDDDYVRVALGKVNGKILASPLPRGAGVITSLTRSDGLLVLDRGIQGAEAGELVDIRLGRSLDILDETIFCIGSHDLTLDLLAQFLAMRGRRLVSTNAGSLGGLLALKKGEAHLAGTHLLDTTTGDFNIAYIQQYLPGTHLKLIALVLRDQGLMVERGNPHAIKDLSDLVRGGSAEDRRIRFVNRQKGAGTRVLLDHNLTRMGIQPVEIQGYDQEEYTHLGVAAAVASGRADCGLGIAAAAHALNLEFIPLFQERYDLAVPKEHADSRLLAPLFDIFFDREFKQAVKAMPGYDDSVMGKIILEV